jgi:predicted TIM-barrel fold metal-dependent hydrolase
MGVITDSQVHIWPAESPDRPWIEGGRAFAHGDEFSVEHLLTSMAVAGVDSAVLVPPSFEGDRNDVCLAAAARYPDRFRVMGRIALTEPARLTTWLDQPGMLGLRVAFSRGPAAGWFEDGTADWLWPAAEAAGLPVMVFAPGRMADIGRIAARHPGLRLVIDHLGIATHLRDDAVAPAIADVLGLARHDNVAVKASCLPNTVTQDYPFPALHEPIRRVVDAFGPRRVFWGSDLSRLRCPYSDVVRLFTEALDLTDVERDWILGRGVREWLNWR